MLLSPKCISENSMDIHREFVLGFVKIHMLYHADKGEFCGVDMMKELKRHGYRIGSSTLYPILHKMENEGYIVSNRRVENGKTKKYYKSTNKGKYALKKIRPKIQELVLEIFEDL